MQFIGVIVGGTDNAFLFQDWFWHGPEWLPRSQSELRRDPETMEAIVNVTDWIAGKKNLKEFAERTLKEIEANARRT